MLSFAAPTVELVFGAPGTGKTTYILNRLRSLLEQGVSVQDVAFISFSKAAVGEVCNRLGIDSVHNRPPWFRTVHSCAFSLLNLRRDQVLTGREVKRFNQVTGYHISPKLLGYRPDVIDLSSQHWSNEAMFVMSSSRALEMSIEDYCNTVSNFTRVRLDDIRSFTETYERYKRAYELLDFADMIENCQTAFPANVQHVFVDEAQDLTPQQWSLVQRLTTHARHMVIVGDDDQTIYAFAGATPRPLLEYAWAHPERVSKLEHSHRLPQKMLELSQRVAASIHRRVPKNITPRDGSVGEVQTFACFTDLNFQRGEWLLLSRHSYLLKPAAQFLQEQGYSFWFRGDWSTRQPELRAITAWQEWLEHGKLPSHGDKRIVYRFRPLTWPPPKMYASLPWYEVFPTIPPIWWIYYQRLRDNGELGSTRIRLSTIHESKGSEADNVAVLTGYSQAVRRQIVQHGETADGHQDELRVLYVALTRVRERLWVQHASQHDNYLSTLLRGIL